MVSSGLALSLAGLFCTAGAARGKFVVTDDSFSDAAATVKLKVLTNTDTGESASINTNWGGGVEALVLRSAKSSKLRDVLWTHSRNATAVKINVDWRGRMLIPYGNRIGGAKYEFNGSVHHLPINDVAGLNNSLHGLIWDRPLHVASQQSSKLNCSVTLSHDFNGSDAGYPFHLHSELTYTLSADGFWVSIDFSNRDPQGWPLPVYNGWHPYILGHTSASTVTLDPCTSWAHVDVGMGQQYPAPRYSNMVPTQHVVPSTQYDGSQPIGGTPGSPTYMDNEVKAISADGCGTTLETRLDDPVTHASTILSHTARYLQVWTGAKTTFGVDAVVLEPLSAMSDGFNNHDGLHILSAGESYTNEFGLRIE